MLNATGADVPSPFVAVTLKLNVPAAVGVPEITPLLLRVSPPGNAPLDTAQRVGLFEAASVTLYAVLYVPPVSAPGVVEIPGVVGAAGVAVCVPELAPLPIALMARTSKV
jgi:hypothetical protein